MLDGFGDTWESGIRQRGPPQAALVYSVLLPIVENARGIFHLLIVHQAFSCVVCIELALDSGTVGESLLHVAEAAEFSFRGGMKTA